MIAIIFFIFGLVLFVSLFPMKFSLVQKILMILLGIILILVAGFREDDVTNDYKVYLSFWTQRDLEGEVELSFIWLRDILRHQLLLPPVYLFLTFATLGVGTKIYAINKLSIYPFLALLIYVGHYYILHELTQIRIGVSAGFFLIAIYYKIEKKIYHTLLFLILAFFFHYSAVIGIILFILNNKDSKFYYFLIPLGYVIFFFNNQLNISIPIPYVQQKMEAYQEMKKWGVGDEINVFNFVFLVRILLLYILFFYAKRISVYNENVYLLLKIYAISLFSFLFLSDNPAFSFRIQEFLGIVEIILLPLIAVIFRNKSFGKLFVILIAIGFIFIDIFYNKYIFK